MAKQDDSLFLLEVLIDKIVFIKTPCFSDKDFRTCVNIECPAVPPLEICDDDPGVCIARSGGPFVKTFNNGKSCLFSLKEADINAAMSKFPVKVSVYKSLPCGCLPTKIVMGEATIDMTKEFVQARKNFLEDPTNVSYQALKDSFRIMGPNGAESGEIIMFLRISCFGKLIITKFQGGIGAPNLGTGGSNTIVDRSCTSKRDFQTAQDPCVCGAARGGSGGAGSRQGRQTCVSGGGGGVCHSARDPYNSMPCDNPDDPCFCSGPMQPTKQNMVCKNTDQYCLHVPKGVPPSALNRQELTGEHWNEINTKDFVQDQRLCEFIVAFIYKYNNAYPQYKTNHEITECLRCLIDKINITEKFQDASCTSICSINYTELSSSFASLLKIFHSQDSNCSTSYNEVNSNIGMFGKRETDVYMNSFNDFSRYRASGTQATAFINKCLQVNTVISNQCDASTLDMNSNYDSTCTVSTLTTQQTLKRIMDSRQYHDVYFFGRKKGSCKSAGMGYNESKIKLHRTEQTSSTTGRRGSSTVINSASVQTKNSKGASTATSTMKAVSIKEDKSKKPCPAAGQTKGDMTATISHIRIGPREPCPVHGKEPCQGPKCIVASSGEEQAPVKVSTVTNPRRGVFEIVIRKITGAPLAKNELMLEWTPPPSRPPPCGVPCSVPCAIPTPCRPPKCKVVVCKPSKCKHKSCKKPCGPSPCKRCCKVTCCGKKCTPCSPPPCKIPCTIPCCASPCSSPCKSSPCLRPCPVGRKRPRKARSQPKIRAKRIRTSPCLNRSKTCPVVRCRSMPGPCIGCCLVPPCPPRKCCSVAPCKPPKCCKSRCSMCCL